MTAPAFVRGFAAPLVAAIAALGLAFAGPARAQEHTLNFRNAEIQAFIDDVSIVTGYTFIVDPEVRGQVTITSQTPLTEEEVFTVFLSTLRTMGFAAVRAGPGVYRILPEAEGAAAGAGRAGEAEGDAFVTSVIRLSNVSAREAARSIGALLSEAGDAQPEPGGNMIVVVDYAANVRAVERALADLDRDTSVVELVGLENVPADEMARIVERLRARSRAGEGETATALTVAPIAASNSLLIRGPRPAVEETVAMVRRVDAVSRSNQTFRVVRLNHADGEQLVPIIQEVSRTLAQGESAPAGGGGARQPSVAFHAPTNALILNAAPDILRELELVISQLDVRRPQVLVEAIIVEISDTAARDLGVQFLVAGDGDDATPFASTRLGQRGSSPDLLALSGALLTDSDDEVNADLAQLAVSSLLGARGALVGVGGQTDDGTLFGLVLNALESDTDSNVLSTPSVMTLDNEEAFILVGQEIPITTGEVLGDNNANPFRTVDRKEVGVQLAVTPQINEGDTIQLLIQQEVSSVAGPVSEAFVELITNTRQISTTVLADDGEIIVLGGLIERDEQYRDDQVPGLGSIPGVGRLFRNETRSESRTNLMVFIRPTIIRSRSDVRGVTERNFDFMTAEQRRAAEGRSSLEEIVDMMTAGADPFASDPAGAERP